MPGSKYKQVKDKQPGMETYLAKVSYVESGDKPGITNPNSTATGLYQFTESTWRGLNDRYNLGYTLEDRKNPEKASNVMRKFTEDNEAVIAPVLGREVNDADRYMAHFLGAGGARKFFTAYNVNPNAPISAVVSPEALKANKAVFYNKDGSLKNLSGVYDWASSKMDIKVQPKVYTATAQTPTKVYNFKEEVPYLPTDTAQLQSSTAEYVEPVTEVQDTVEVQQAKQQINEQNFMQELGSIFTPQAPPDIPQQVEVGLDPSAYDYINIEEYQQGGTIEQDRQWLQNWYENRQIPNERIQSLYEEDKPYFTELSNFIPDPTIVDTIDPNEPAVTGRYEADTGRILMTPNASPSTFLHEGTHRTQDFMSAMRPVHQIITNKNVRPKEEMTGYYKDDYNYFTDPDEVHARIQVLRQKAGIKPDQVVTPEFLQNFLKTYKGDETNINDLLNITDENGLLQMLNYMASNDTPTENNLV